jgi:hypothetical protein
LAFLNYGIIFAALLINNCGNNYKNSFWASVDNRAFPRPLEVLFAEGANPLFQLLLMSKKAKIKVLK